MIRSYWLRWAGIVAILGGLAQTLVLSSQLQQWFLMQQSAHVTWEWAVTDDIWEAHVPWVIALPWALVFLALIALQVATARQTGRLGWICAAVAGTGMLMLLADEIGAIVSPKCLPPGAVPVPCLPLGELPTPPEGRGSWWHAARNRWSALLEWHLAARLTSQGMGHSAPAGGSTQFAYVHRGDGDGQGFTRILQSGSGDDHPGAAVGCWLARFGYSPLAEEVNWLEQVQTPCSVAHPICSTISW